MNIKRCFQNNTSSQIVFQCEALVQVHINADLVDFLYRVESTHINVFITNADFLKDV